MALDLFPSDCSVESMVEDFVSDQVMAEFEAWACQP
jgi:hypothetical protein